MLSGLGAWILITLELYGKLNLDTLGREWPMFGGNMVAVGVSLLVCVTTSLVWPESFHWGDMMAVERLADRPGDMPLPPQLERAAVTFTVRSAILVTVVLLVVWPCLALPFRVFSETYFTL